MLLILNIRFSDTFNTKRFPHFIWGGSSEICFSLFIYDEYGYNVRAVVMLFTGCNPMCLQGRWLDIFDFIIYLPVCHCGVVIHSRYTYVDVFMTHTLAVAQCVFKAIDCKKLILLSTCLFAVLTRWKPSFVPNVALLSHKGLEENHWIDNDTLFLTIYMLYIYTVPEL